MIDELTLRELFGLPPRLAKVSEANISATDIEAQWQPTNEYRITPVAGFETLSKFNRDTGITVSTTMPRYNQQRLWVRMWAEKEWR